MRLSKTALELKKKDPVLAKIILENLGDLESSDNIYESLLSSIISQQISTKAATSIKAKFIKLFKNKFPTTKQLLRSEDQLLKSAGLSRQKIAYMKNVATHFLATKLDYNSMENEEIISDLVQIKGVGEWTVEMILIFSLLRPDVYSYKDLALTNTIIELYKIKKEKYSSKKLKTKVLKITYNWTPHRSLASRYLWHYRGNK